MKALFEQAGIKIEKDQEFQALKQSIEKIVHRCRIVSSNRYLGPALKHGGGRDGSVDHRIRWQKRLRLYGRSELNTLVHQRMLTSACGRLFPCSYENNFRPFSPGWIALPCGVT